MSRVSQMEFYNNKDVIQQIQWLKDHLGGSTMIDVRLEQDTDPTSENFGRVTMTFVMEDGTEYSRYFDNSAVQSITSRQVGNTVVITFHLTNGQTYEVSCEIHVTATASWSSLTGSPSDNSGLTDRIYELGDGKYATSAGLAQEVSDRAGADTALGGRIDGVISDVQALGPQIAARAVAINGSISLPAASWTSGGTATYPYEAMINVSGVTQNDWVDVAFGETDALSGNFAPFCNTVAGGFKIYSKIAPTAVVSIGYNVVIMGVSP